MFPALSKPARRWAAIIAALALVSVGAQFVYLNDVRVEEWTRTVWSMARYFTILTVVLVAVTWALTAYRRDGLPASWLAALTLAMVMVGGVYHALLADLVDYSGLGFWADHGLHTALPVACALWWLIYAPKRHLSFGDLPVFLLWPAIYLSYALWRGSLDGIYPYPFLDLGTMSAAAVATNIAGLIIAFLLGGVIMVSIGRFADR